MASGQERPVLSHDQAAQYLHRLGISEKQRVYDVAGLEPQDAYQYLVLLQKHHLAEIPFENLTLHYSPHRQISLHPQELFRKIIGDNNGRGGYCMENNGLFAILLRTLGFKVYSVGARVLDDGTWSGWSHMTIIITVGISKYHVDVGFGGNGPIQPMKLDRSGTTQEHIRPATCRVQWQNIDANSDPEQRLWVYEHQAHEGGPFRVIYCFTELEFLPSDYNLMNYYTSTSPQIFFTRLIVAEKKILGENGDIVGNLTLGNCDLKWRVHGEKKREIKFGNEEGRVMVLEEHFGIKLSQVERDSILGLASEMK